MDTSTTTPITTPVTTTGTADSPALLAPEEIVRQLRLLRQQIPEYVQLPLSSAASLRGVASAHPAFVQAAINAIGASTTVQAAVGRTPEELQQAAELPARWTAVADELRAMLKGVEVGVMVRKHSVALPALQAYGISRQLVRQPEHADLLPFVETMTRIRRLGKRAVVSQQPAPQAPQPGSAAQQHAKTSAV